MTSAPSTLPAASPLAESLGVYVHFPYCLQKCPYCDFLSVPVERREIPHGPYANAVIRELELRAASLDAGPLRSVFFGGGTPSLWEPRELGRVLAAISSRFCERLDFVEITAECNPSSFDARVAEGLLEAGVNRISLGVQSLDAGRLAFLGRLHDGDGAIRALRLALDAGFARVSADLIFGVAGQSAEQAAEEARQLAGLGLSHLSAYALTIEPGTRFGELDRRGRLPLLADEVVADTFLAVERALETEGLAHYEVSNYARPGSEAAHNLGYWRGQQYLGLGAGAWGTLRRRGRHLRTRTTPSIERYLRLPDAALPLDLDAEGEFVAVVEELSAETALSERVMLGLRLAEGLDVQLLEAETGAPFWTRERRRAVDKWRQRGALRLDGERLRLAKDCWLLADGIIRELI